MSSLVAHTRPHTATTVVDSSPPRPHLATAPVIRTVANTGTYATHVTSRIERVRRSDTFTVDVAEKQVCTTHVIRQLQSSSPTGLKHSAQPSCPATRAQCRWKRGDRRMGHDCTPPVSLGTPSQRSDFHSYVTAASGECDCSEALEPSIGPISISHMRGQRCFCRTRRQERKYE